MVCLSHSRIQLFHNCRRWYLYRYIQGLPDDGDKSFANAGKLVHSLIETWYKDKSLPRETLRAFFDAQWLDYKLDDSQVSSRKESYWGMVTYLMSLNIPLTSVEFKVSFDDFIGFIDGIDEENKIIYDWKTSTPGEWNEEEYKEQLYTYAWLVKRKLGWVPKKAKTYYLKSPGDVIEIQPSEATCTFMDMKVGMVRKEIAEEKEWKKCCDDGSKCSPFCPYRDKCFGTKIEFKLVIEKARVYVRGYMSELLKRGLKKEFSYEMKNAKHIRRHSRFDGIVRLYDDRTMSVSLGFMERLVKSLKEYCDYRKKELVYTVEDRREPLKKFGMMPIGFVNGVKLYDYQQAAVDDFMKRKVGILELATSAGKTECAIDIMRQIDATTLFLCDRKELLHQTKTRIEKALGIPVGIIGDAEKDIQQVTVATLQTIALHLDDYKDYLKTVHFFIVDEAHIAAAASVQKIGKACVNAHYIMGLSATPYRDDGEDMKIESACGPIVHSLPLSKLVELGHATKPTIIFQKLGPTQMSYEYEEDYKSSVFLNEERNRKIAELAENNKGKKMLILTKLVDHGATLQTMIPGSIHIHGSVEKKKRMKDYEEFVTQPGGVLIATMSIASKGLDIKALEIICNACGNKGDVNSIQALGRCVRKLEGKKNAYYYDFADMGRHTKRHSKARMEAFKAEGHEVQII